MIEIEKNVLLLFDLNTVCKMHTQRLYCTFTKDKHIECIKTTQNASSFKTVTKLPTRQGNTIQKPIKFDVKNLH